MQNPRAAAASLLRQILIDGRSLSSLIPAQLSAIENAKDKSFAQAMIFGVMRQLLALDYLQCQLMQKPLKSKDADIEILLLLGLYQLREMRTPSYAAINETVKLVPRKKSWARGLLNGVLREYLRQQTKLEEKLRLDVEAASAHPQWLIEYLQRDWGEQWQSIVEANNTQAPMSLRVNRRKQTREEYLQQLSQQGIAAHPCRFAPFGVVLESAMDVAVLPGFTQGCVSVQDEAAQMAATILKPATGDYIVDTCAAPGGKTAALLEQSDDLRIVALDLKPERLEQVEQTLSRLGLHADCQAMDARELDKHLQANSVDKLLLDVPCSATGVIRRNPDVKYHRQKSDIDELVKTQAQILESAWRVLKPGGVLLYATCSIIRDENDKQLQAFLQQHADARERPIASDWGSPVSVGRQILPGENNMDGFFYALLEKTS
ncbi:MAG: 16S rRNA (cytosine(967)-C(5))-methyltransferase RsmB [Gammaproteobacteria bacterium]|nr:16S rRNA (cytosine(967)-C(5))-methyltransferase RsmB [Gammaproteobacteria bacterium]